LLILCGARDESGSWRDIHVYTWIQWGHACIPHSIIKIMTYVSGSSKPSKNSVQTGQTTGSTKQKTDRDRISQELDNFATEFRDSAATARANSSRLKNRARPEVFSNLSACFSELELFALAGQNMLTGGDKALGEADRAWREACKLRAELKTEQQAVTRGRTAATGEDPQKLSQQPVFEAWVLSQLKDKNTTLNLNDNGHAARVFWGEALKGE
jgi:hypothetical protein